MFRYERPQKGRYRQFHQIDAETLGSLDPRTDAELLAMLRTFFQELGLTDLDFEVNSLGCPECRPTFRAAVMGFLKGKAGELCTDCQRRMQVNPLRIFDCKVESCGNLLQDAPRIVDSLGSDCRDHLTALERHLSALEIPYSLNPLIVRGLDYYTRTTFEVISKDLGAHNAVCGGGRYDKLIHDLGGPDLPGIGFAIGEERLVSVVMEKAGRAKIPMDLFVAAMGSEAEREAFLWVEKARRLGLRAEMDFRGGSLKSQLRRAGKLGAKRVMILGEKELRSGIAALRDMDSAEQIEIPLIKLEETLTQWSKGNS
jgi:histidyl-tRNA synthetase